MSNTFLVRVNHDVNVCGTLIIVPGEVCIELDGSGERGWLPAAKVALGIGTVVADRIGLIEVSTVKFGSSTIET